MRVTSIASARLSGGRIEGTRWASIVLPVPGGPLSRQLWPPAAATIKRPHRVVLAAHVAEIRSLRTRGPRHRSAAVVRLGQRVAGGPPLQHAHRALQAARPRRPRARRPASPPARAGREHERRQPASAQACATASVPWQARTPPSSASSPNSAWRVQPLAGSCPLAASTAHSERQVEPGPALRTSPGARLAVMRRAGNSYPELRIAACTRSRASRTAVIGEPDDRERRQARADVDLDGDVPGLQSLDRERACVRASSSASCRRVGHPR